MNQRASRPDVSVFLLCAALIAAVVTVATIGLLSNAADKPATQPTRPASQSARHPLTKNPRLNASIEQLLSGNDTERVEAMQGLEKMDAASHAARPALILVAYCGLTNNDEVSGKAVALLEKFGPPRSQEVPVLIAWLDHRNAYAAGVAAACLGSLGPEAKTALPRLIAKLALLKEDKEAALRPVPIALRQIGPDGVKAAIVVLRPWLKDNDKYVRLRGLSCIHALGIGAKSVLPDMQRALTDDYDAVRSCAAQTIGDWGPQAVSAAPALMPLLEDKSPEVRLQAAKALLRMGKLPASAVAKLPAAMEGQNERIRSYLIIAMAISTHEAKWITPLMEIASQRLFDCPGPGVYQLDLQIVMPALLALGEIGPADKRIIPFLAERLDSPDMYTRIGTAKAIAMCGPSARSAAPMLEQAVQKAKTQEERQCLLAALDAVLAAPPLGASQSPASTNEEKVRPVSDSPTTRSTTASADASVPTEAEAKALTEAVAQWLAYKRKAGKSFASDKDVVVAAQPKMSVSRLQSRGRNVWYDCLTLPLTITNRSSADVQTKLAHEWYGGLWPPTDLYFAMIPPGSKKADFSAVFLAGEKGELTRPTVLKPGESCSVRPRINWPGTGSVHGHLYVREPGRYVMMFVLVFEAAGKPYYVQSDPIVLNYTKKPTGRGKSSRSTPPRPANQPATRLVKEYAAKIKETLPEGWSMDVARNVITIQRDRPVEWYGLLSLPAHKDKADLKAKGFIQSSAYTIRLEFAPPMTDKEAARLEAENDRITRAYYDAHPTPPDAKPNGRPKALTEKLHRVPEVRLADHSVYVTTSIGGPNIAFYDDAVAAECDSVGQDVRAILSVPLADAPATQPATRPAG